MKSFQKKIALSVSVVLYNNTSNDLKKFISLVEQNTKYFNICLIIFDNSPVFHKNFNFSSSLIEIKYIPSQKNIGFGKGHNLAFLHSPKNAKFHILLNPDLAIYDKDLFIKLYSTLKSRNNYSAIAPKLLNFDNSLQSVGRYDSSLFQLFCRRFISNSIFTNIYINIDNNKILNIKSNSELVNNISGAFIFFKKKLIKDNKIFDERYFLYMEDFDLCRRLRNNGSLLIRKDLRLYHSRARGSYYKFDLFFHHLISLFKYKIKWFGSQKIKNEKIIFIISTSPFILDNFFKNHIAELARNYRIILISNINEFDNVSNYVKHNLVNFPIQRKISLFKDFFGLIYFSIIAFIVKPNLIIGLGPKAGIFSGLGGFLSGTKNRLFIFQGQVWANKKGIIRKTLKFMDFLIAFFNNNLLCVGKNEMHFLIKNKITTAKKIKILGNGSINGVDINIKVNKKNNLKLKNKIFKNPKSFVFGFIGRLNIDKGIKDLESAFLELSLKYDNVNLLLVGSNEMFYTPKNSKLIKVLPYQQDLSDIYPLIDCLILPSYREGLPITILEAMMFRIPVIGSKIYGIESIISDYENGLLFEAGNVPHLIEKMEILIKDKKLRNKIIKNANIYVKNNFDTKIVVEKYVSYIKGILDG